MKVKTLLNFWDSCGEILIYDDNKPYYFDRDTKAKLIKLYGEREICSIGTPMSEYNTIEICLK